MRTGLMLIVVLAAAPAAGGTGPGDILINSIGMKLVHIPPGNFTMGSPNTEPGRIANETRRQVTFAKGFRIGVTEVTQKEWRLIMGTILLNAWSIALHPTSAKTKSLCIRNDLTL
jgi:formylglycine-generating enzyme required for sulfatase activity